MLLSSSFQDGREGLLCSAFNSLINVFSKKIAFRFGGRNFSKCVCSELKTRTRSLSRTPI